MFSLEIKYNKENSSWINSTYVSDHAKPKNNYDW